MTVSRRRDEENVEQTELGGKGSTGGNWIGGTKTPRGGEHPIAQSEESALQEEETDASAVEMGAIRMVRERSKGCPPPLSTQRTWRERWMRMGSRENKKRLLRAVWLSVIS